VGAAAGALLPPPPSPNGGGSSVLANITVVGTALCAAKVPRLTSLTVGGVPCAGIACPIGLVPGEGDGGSVTCIGWNATAAAAGVAAAGVDTAARVQLNASATWSSPSQTLHCEACVTAFVRPSLVSIVLPTSAAAGVPVVLTGDGFMDASRTPPAVYIGDVPCRDMVVLPGQAVQCTTPDVPATTDGFPVVPVVVTNAARASSTEAVTVMYPAAFAASWAAGTTVLALPGTLVAPSPMLTVLSREAATCALSFNASACNSNATLARPTAGMAVQAGGATPLTVRSSGNENATSTALTLGGLTVSGASECAATLVAACSDAEGNTATTAG